MKKILFACLIVLGLSSCTALGPKYSSGGFVVDYAKYDMFISEATAVSFDYQPLGSVVAYVSNGYYNRDFVVVTPDDAVRVLVDEARRIGAYGIINVQIKNRPGNENEGQGYTATGMAIRW